MEDSFLLWQLALQCVLIMLNAIFACAEIAVLSLNEHKLASLADANNKKAKQLIELKKQPAKFLSTIQVAITLSGFLASAFAADNFSDSLVNLFLQMGIEADLRLLDAVAVVVITLILSYVTLVFGELVPKRVAMKKAQTLALMLSSLLVFVSKIAAPLVWLLTKSTNTVLKLIGINPDSDDDDNLSEEEILLLLEASSQKGIIDAEENTIIKNLFNFDDLDISKITTHRTQVKMLWLEDSIDTWLETMCTTRHRHYLVCDKVIDNVVGVVKMKDFFCIQGKSKEEIVAELVRPAFVVLEAVHADIVFEQMKKRKEQFAVVVDEYGGLTGVVTIKDLLGHLVGNIDEDFIPDDDSILQNNDNEWYIKGDASLGEVMNKLHLTLPVDDYNTFAGFVFGLYGSIPEDGAGLELETDELFIQVEKIERHTFARALVKIKQ